MIDFFRIIIIKFSEYIITIPRDIIQIIVIVIIIVIDIYIDILFNSRIN